MSAERLFQPQDIIHFRQDDIGDQAQQQKPSEEEVLRDTTANSKVELEHPEFSAVWGPQGAHEWEILVRIEEEYRDNRDS